jgi:hypothetical protein
MIAVVLVCLTTGNVLDSACHVVLRQEVAACSAQVFRDAMTTAAASVTVGDGEHLVVRCGQK